MTDEIAVTSSPDQQPDDEQEQAPLVGKTNRMIYALTLLASLAVVTVLMFFVARGSIAVAASLPGSFNIQASSLSGTGFSLAPGLSPSGQPVVVSTFANATISNEVITKTISLLGGHTVTVTISAGNGSGGAASASNLVTDIFSQSSGTATLTNLKITDLAGPPEGIQQAADSTTLTNVSINSPFLSASSITLPNLSIGISAS